MHMASLQQHATWCLDIYVILQSHRTATSLRSAKLARSPLIAAGWLWDLRAPWEHCRSQEGLQGRRGRSQVLNMLKTSAVRSQRKQVVITSQLTRRRVAAGTPRAPCHRCDVAQGARSLRHRSRIAVRICVNMAKYLWYSLGTNTLKFMIPVNKWPHSNYTTCGVYL